MTGANPAQLSGVLARLFPPGVLAAELYGPGDPSLLLPGEAGHLDRAAPIRVHEFAAGRLCARRVLAELGLRDRIVEIGSRRQPLWPEGIVGSITHTSDYAAAVVAPRARMRSLGIDTEIADRVHADLWASVTVEAELAWLRGLPEPRRRAAAALIFSAKEAFYKCQYPITGEFLGFRDVSIHAEGSPSMDEDCEIEFEVMPMRSIALEAHAGAPWRGRLRAAQGRVTAAIGIAAV